MKQQYRLVCSDIDGTILNDAEITPQDMQQAIIEYLADYYAPDWNPWSPSKYPGERR